MKFWKKLCITVLAAAAASGCFGMTLLAAKNDKITSIRLEVRDIMVPGGPLGENDELSIEAKSNQYSVRDWEIENDSTVWAWSDVPEVKVTLVTEDDYYFSVTRDEVMVKGGEASVCSVKKEEPQILTIVLNLQPMYERVGMIDDARLNGTAAEWTPAVGAESYDIYLYRDNRGVGSKKNVTDTVYDFGMAMRKEGEYYYKVRAVGREGAKEGRLTESESFYVSPDAAAQKNVAKNNKSSGETKKKINNSEHTPNQWLQDEKGWRYAGADGSRAVGWTLIDGEKYYFDAEGYMTTGWMSFENQWYYLGTEGNLETNCLTPDGYIVDENGARVWEIRE